MGKQRSTLTVLCGLALILLPPILIGCGGGYQETGTLQGNPSPGAGPSLASLVSQRQQLRLYEGAPPVIPHPVEDYGRSDCLSCHLEGNAVSMADDRLAPVTPHPEEENCVQCHVEQRETSVFKQNMINGLEPAARADLLHELAPPYIPHRLQDRHDCRSCHIGMAVPGALVPAHGDRVNCRQCHVQLLRASAPFEPASHRGG